MWILVKIMHMYASFNEFGPRCARVAVDPGKTKYLRAASFCVSFGVVFLFGCARVARGFTAGLRDGANTSGSGVSGGFIDPRW